MVSLAINSAANTSRRWVMFEHGNPNRPIVTSAQYNSSNNEPYHASDNPHVTAITTHTQGSKDPSQGHKLVFDDTPNKESLNLHSENDLNTNVLGDLTQTLQGGQTTTVNKHHLTHVLSGKAEFTAHEMHIHANVDSHNRKQPALSCFSILTRV